VLGNWVKSNLGGKEDQRKKPRKIKRGKKGMGRGRSNWGLEFQSELGVKKQLRPGSSFYFRSRGILSRKSKEKKGRVRVATSKKSVFWNYGTTNGALIKRGNQQGKKFRMQLENLWLGG